MRDPRTLHNLFIYLFTSFVINDWWSLQGLLPHSQGPLIHILIHRVQYQFDEHIPTPGSAKAGEGVDKAHPHINFQNNTLTQLYWVEK
jgi:hypothetical protein